MMRATLVTRPIDVSSLAASVAAATNGATALFVGTVRSFNDGRPVTGIEYSAYAEMAEHEMTSILAEACERFGIADATLEHRLGKLAPGEASIGVAVAHPHRADAMDALRRQMRVAMIDFRLAVHALLTAEQVEKLKSMPPPERGGHGPEDCGGHGGFRGGAEMESHMEAWRGYLYNLRAFLLQR